jgi:hypothetical protein
MASPDSSSPAEGTTGSSSDKISGITEKKLQFLLSALGLHKEISMSQLRWVLKAVTPEIKNSITTQYKSYKNISGGKNKGQAV